ncbi:MAG TPA: tetratricopeptide repeat protein [Chthonomonadaceae bacterium]|nr:tetratricopeptide repeat protein [Chthonomonadaceae bacterium]
MTGSVHEAHFAGFSVCLLGSLEVRSNGHLITLRTRSEKWLLALLVLQNGREVEREWLSGILWPDSVESQALYNLRRELGYLKADLGQESVRLQTTFRTLLLDLQQGFCDVMAFDAAMRRKDIAALQAAVGLYRGPLLQDCQEEWAHLERIQREQAYLSALDTLATDALTRQEWSEASRYTRLLIAADPLQEGAHRTLMDALAQSGNHPAATQVYRDLRLRLREVLNAEPDADTQALYERIRHEARQQALSLPRQSAIQRPPSPPPAPSVPAAASALPPLPRPITRLIGREEALAEALPLLHTSRLLTLTGAGGVGKTRLALEIAHTAAPEYADGVAFADLSPLTDPSLVLQTLAGACNIREAAGTPLQTTLMATLQTQRLLLLVDNCEHLLNAIAPLLHSLLQHCPGLSVLATSRQSLGLTGEVLWRVPSLSIPPQTPATLGNKRAKQDNSGLLEYPAVQLFVERVHQTNPEFRFTPANLPIIARICQRLDGIPLALELAAGRVRALSVEQIAERLQDRFKLLTGGNRAALPRQQTLRALIDWSYTLLEEEEKRLLIYLSVFPGGWTLEAAESICAGESIEDWEVLDLLTSLVDKSLVVIEEQSGEVRYRMLETIRQFAQEQWDPEGTERIEVMRKLCNHYSAFSSNFYQNRRKADGADWLRRAGIELENLRTVLDFCTQDAPSWLQGLRIGANLGYFWDVCGLFSEGRRHLESFLASPQEQKPIPERFGALNTLGFLAREQGDYIAARKYTEESLEVAQELNDLKSVAFALGHLGSLYYYLGENDRAIDYFRREQEIYEKIGTPLDRASNLHNIALVFYQQENYAEARNRLERALAINRQHENRQWEMYNLLILSRCALGLQDELGAEDYLHQTLALSQELDSRNVMAMVWQDLGWIVLKRGKAAEAEALFLQCLPIFQESGKRDSLGMLFLYMSEAALQQAQWENGLQFFLTAEAVYAELGGFHSAGKQNQRDELQARFSDHLSVEALARAQEQTSSLTLDERIARILENAPNG